MSALHRLLLTLALIALFAFLIGRAADVEAARAHNAGVRATICQVFGPRCGPAVRVAYCETGGTMNPRAANWTDRHSDGSRGSFGVFQVGALHRARGESVAAFARRMFNPLANSRVAYRLSRGGTNWRPWSCRP